MNLFQSLKLIPGDICSLVGGGGKTSLLYSLAKEDPWGKTLLTTSTMMWDPEGSVHPFAELIIRKRSSLPDAKRVESPCFIAASRVPEKKKVRGFSSDEISRWKKSSLWKLIVIEADGASCRPLKMPDIHEPQIPEATTVTIAVIGLDILGKPASEANIHRFPLVQKRIGLKEGERVSLQHLAAVIDHPEGLFKDSPPEAKKILILNKADTLIRESHPTVEEILEEIADRTSLPDQILITILSDYSNPVILSAKNKRSNYDPL